MSAILSLRKSPKMDSSKRRKTAHDAPKKKPVVEDPPAKASPEPSEEESATLEAPSTEEDAPKKTFKDLVSWIEPDCDNAC